MNDMLLQIFDLVTTFAMLLVFIRFMLQFAGMDASEPLISPAYKTKESRPPLQASQIRRPRNCSRCSSTLTNKACASAGSTGNSAAMGLIG